MSAPVEKEVRGGGPIRAMAGLFLCWIAVRIALFEMPFERPSVPELVPALARLASTETGSTPVATPRRTRPPAGGQVIQAAEPIAPVSWPQGRVEPPAYPGAALAPPLPEPRIAPRAAAGHNLLWMAAMQGMPLLPAVHAAMAGQSPATVPADASRRAARWSGDGWVLWREGARGIAAAGAATPVYGGSQAGVVLRYALVPESPLRPAAYLRAVHALDVARESDLAAGVALRPLPGIPVTAHAEGRLARRGDRLSVVPAAFVSAGIDEMPAGGGVTLRGYAQAGYVGGRDSTGFADGSLIAEKRVWNDRDSALVAGAGAWGGAQRGAGRLDLGPSASLRFRLGDGTARLSADYRLRVAGDAAPARGAAVTLAAGF